MFRRLTLTLTLAAVMVAALSVAPAVAQPVGDKADVQCLKLALQTHGFGPGLNPGNTNFVGGTEGPDDFTSQGTEGRDIFCGFGGEDYIEALDEEDIFLGGTGDDTVIYNYGTFYGGEGYDRVSDSNHGTFYGGAGDDFVDTNYGTFYGGAGNDTIYFNNGGTYVR